MIQLHDLQFQPYLSTEDIQTVVSDLAKQISLDYRDKTPLFIGVLNGSFIFLSDLVRSYNGDCEMSFVKYTSYEGTSSTGKITTDLAFPGIEGRDVIVVEDIVDTGNTLAHIYKELENANAASIAVVSLFLKPEVYKKDFKIDYVGKEIPNKFIVGYGLDYNGLGRNLPEIYQLNTTQND